MDHPVAGRTFQELCARWHDVDRQLKRAQANSTRREKEYCATPEGMARTQRRIDLCTDSDELEELLAARTRGQVAAAAEFRARLANNPEPDPRDGYLFSMPLGDGGALARQLITDSVMGTFRVEPGNAGAVPVQLRRIVTDRTQRRCEIWCPFPSAGPLTLTAVVRHCFRTGAADKLVQLFEGDHRPLLTVLETDCGNTDVPSN